MAPAVTHPVSYGQVIEYIQGVFKALEFIPEIGAPLRPRLLVPDRRLMGGVR